MRKSLRPSQIRFTQDSISSYFRSKTACRRFRPKHRPNGPSVNGTAADLVSGRIRASDFPLMQVAEVEGKYYSLNNRRLYIFRYAEISQILSEVEVEMVSYRTRFTSTNDGRTVTVRKGKPLQHCKDDWLVTPSVQAPNPDNASVLQDVDLELLDVSYWDFSDDDICIMAHYEYDEDLRTEEDDYYDLQDN